MGKSDFLTPKAIANRIKAKGLQKLRWYCQMCQKQCRDENGFKCHCMSESHQRQMAIFGQAPDRIVDGFSDEFLEEFLTLLRRAHRSSRVAATVKVCWEKFARYFEVELKEVKLTEGYYVMDPQKAVDLVDENTICVAAILGSTLNGEFEDVKTLNDLLVKKNEETG